MNKKKYFNIALIFICIISITLIGTYALKLWSSTNNTELTFRIGEYSTNGITCKTSEDITVSNIGPIFDYNIDGEIISFTVVAGSSNEEKLYINFNIENITSNLKEESFKYILLSSTDKTNYNEVVSGNFLNVNSNDTIELISNYVITKTTYYKLIIYIDGNMENPISMQNGSITGNLEVCSSEKFDVTLNVTNGTSDNNILKVPSGDNAIFTITPNDGYTLDIESKTCEGILNSSTGIYTINNITENKECNLTLKEDGPIKKGSLADYIITTYTSKNAIGTRSDFSSVFTETNDKIYTTNKTEDGSTVYYYAGNTTHNWVKFGKYTSDWYSCSYTSNISTIGGYYTMGTSCSYDENASQYTTKLASKNDDIYWKIIRTNEDGSVRLLYSGNTPDTTKGYIGMSKYSGADYVLYTGYMYGTTGSLANNRLNTNSSTIKQNVDSWYKTNLYNSDYNNYVSKTAIYCNDRSVGSGEWRDEYVSGEDDVNFRYASDLRIRVGKSPSYKCGVNANNDLIENVQSVEDKFSVSTTNGGNSKLTYPIALMTIDEVAFAGGVYYTNLASHYAWYFSNSTGGSNTQTSWWTMTPYYSNTVNRVWLIDSNGDGYQTYGKITETNINYAMGVRPVISLKSCVKYSSGDGSSTNPYTVTIDDDCASKEN